MGWNEQLRAQHQNNNCQDRLVLRSAPHVLRRGRYVYVNLDINPEVIMC